MLFTCDPFTGSSRVPYILLSKSEALESFNEFIKPGISNHVSYANSKKTAQLTLN